MVPEEVIPLPPIPATSLPPPLLQAVMLIAIAAMTALFNIDLFMILFLI
jgi:hypothetical protein